MPPGRFLLAAAALAAGSAFFLARRRTALSLALIIAAAFAAGAARTAVVSRDYGSGTLRFIQPEGYVDLRGRLVRSPDREPDRDILTMRLSSIGAGGRVIPMGGVVRLAVPFRPGDGDGRLRFGLGDAVEAAAMLSGPAGFRNFGAFSYDRYLQGLGVARRAHTKSPLLVGRTAQGSRLSPRAFLSRTRVAAQGFLERRFPGGDGRDISPGGAVLEALLLGEDGRMACDDVLMLQKSGLYHLIAISGGHIAVIAFMVHALLRACGAGPRRRLLGLGIFLVFYSMLVEAGPTVLRAVIMAETMIAGRLLSRDLDLVNSVSFSAFILLLAGPFGLFDAGFQLTYAATLAIVVLAPRFQRRLPRLPLGITALAAMSAAASLGVMPIIARNFNRVTLASLILNFAAVPLTALIMGLGYVFLAAGPILGPAAVPFAKLLDLLITALVRVGGLLDPVPWLSYRVPTPPWPVFWGYYLFLVLAVAASGPHRSRGLRTAGVATCAACALLIMFHPFAPVSKGLTVTMIDVGQGDSFLVEFPGRARMLIDGGGLAGGSFDVGEKVVSPFLWGKGISRLDVVVLSHPHPDHAGGLEAVVRNFAPAEVWEGRADPDDAAYRRFERAIRPTTARLSVAAGYSRVFGGVLVEVLHPPAAEPGERLDPNAASLVLKVTYGRRSFLFTGDIGAAAEHALAASGRDLRASVLKIAHHGSPFSTTEEFLRAVSPEAALISVGAGNTFGFPSPAVLARLARAGAAVFRTDNGGSAEVSTDGRVLRVRTPFSSLFVDSAD